MYIFKIKQIKQLLLRNGVKKLANVMKIAAFLTFFFSLQLIAVNSYSQSTRLNLDMETAKIKDVLMQIENQSEFYFLYNGKLVDVDKTVSIHAENQSITNVLSQLFDNREVAVKIIDRQIVLLPATMESDFGIVPSVLQGIAITGTVTDSNGEPLPGVTVIIKGTTQGTATDVDGTYSLSVPGENEILMFSYIGFFTQEITVGSQRNINITLIEDARQLEEVVVVGYGAQKKVNLTGAVANISFENEAITSRPLTSASAALSGLMPGLVIRQSSGDPNSDGASIRVRGVGTLNNSDPLVLIDGQPGDLNSLSPSDISSISVLKDAASAAIYGSRAANGVILVTTKAGMDSGGKVTFNYTGNIGFTNPTKLYELVTNTADHMTISNLVYQNSGQNQPFSQELINEWREKSKTDPILYPNTNWWDVLLTPNTINNHALSARGGNSKINFYTSFNFLDNNGIMKNTAFKRYTFKNTLTYQVNSWLKMGNTITAMFGKAEPVSPEYVFQWFLVTTPGLLPKHPDGRYGGAMTPGEASANNQFIALENSLGERNTQRYNGKLFATITPVKGFDITGSYYIDMYNYDAWSSNRPTTRWNFQTETPISVPSGILSINNSYSKAQRHVFDVFANYSKTFAELHNIQLLAGFNQEYYKSQYFSAAKQDLFSLDTPVLDAAPTMTSSGGSASDFAMRSFFGRINYDYANKYLFEVNLRADGSSRFSPDNRWGYFPSFSAGWRISEETFWENLKPTVDNLKLRGSWGQLGNNMIGNYDWQDLFAVANHSFNGVAVTGLAPNAIANNLITWETTEVINVGADVTLFGALNLSLEYYNKYTHGILYRDPIPYVNGGLTAPMVNSAEVRNTGFEYDVNYRTKIGKDFIISIGLNGAVNHNKIEKYKDGLLEVRGVSAWKEGQPIDKFYVREIDHIVQDKAEIDRLVADGWTFNPSVPGPGDFLYKNNNGDKAINDEDKVLKGNPIPIFSYGGTLSMEYRGFDFYGLITGISGWDRYTSSTLFSLDTYPNYMFHKSYMNAWTETNHSTTIPKIYYSNPKNQQVSDYHLHDASYMRVKTLQLGYTLPAKMSKRIFMDKLRAYINLENFFTFTSYPGMDPEATGSTYQADTNYPLLKTVSFGLNISF